MSLELFGNNIFFIYLVSCLAIINYGKYEEWQKVALIYIATWGSLILNVIAPKLLLIGVLTVLFAFCEYFTDDKAKLLILTNPIYKALDFFFMAFFQYHLILVLVGVFLNSSYFFTFIDHLPYARPLLKLLSSFLFFLSIHFMSAPKFKVKTMTELLAVFKRYPLQYHPPSSCSGKYYAILVQMEDKSYYSRGKSFNFISWDFLKEKYLHICNTSLERARQHTTRDKPSPLRVQWGVLMGIVRMLKRVRLRGYSTLEMQLIRNIGIEKGPFNRIVVRRKIYEIIYTKIFFSGLYAYYATNYAYSKNGHGALPEFKAHLLDIYIRNVDTRINGYLYSPFINVFKTENKELPDMATWGLEAFFVACLGLPQASTPIEARIYRYQFLIDENEMDIGKIYSAIEAHGAKHPHLHTSAIPG